MLRKTLGSTALAVVTASLLLAPLASTSRSQDVMGRDCEEDKTLAKLQAKVASDLDVLANELSLMLAQDATRTFFAEAITKAKKRTVGLGQALGALRVKAPNNSAKRVEATIKTVRNIESAMTEFGVEAARIDIKLPVKAHVELLKGAQEVFVAIAPLADEKDVDSVIAFSNGKRLELAADDPPEVPTLVIIGAEPQSDDPGYPVPVVKQPGNEERKGEVDDYVGIPYIYIYDDNEGWLCGDPEIYVRIKRFRFSTFSVINQRVDLPSVNDEKKWYYLGDPNSTYKYVNTNDYAPVIRLEFWEDDDGFHNGDDHLGSINIWWTNLPFGGYTEYVAGDVRFRIDRD